MRSSCSSRNSKPGDYLKEFPMEGSIWIMLAFIFFAGALGGAVNALMTDNGFLMPKSERSSGGTNILRPGCLGNVLIGAVAAVVSWGLYGPLSTYFIAGTSAALAANSSPEKVGLSLASLIGAVLVGIGGARWLSGEVDKNLLRAAAADAAGKQPSAEASRRIAMVSPAQALNVVNSMT
jgi:hypothetical protein